MDGNLKTLAIQLGGSLCRRISRFTPTIWLWWPALWKGMKMRPRSFIKLTHANLSRLPENGASLSRIVRMSFTMRCATLFGKCNDSSFVAPASFPPGSCAFCTAKLPSIFATIPALRLNRSTIRIGSKSTKHNSPNCPSNLNWRRLSGMFCGKCHCNRERFYCLNTLMVIRWNRSLT